jgi:hypothetical protein
VKQKGLSDGERDGRTVSPDRSGDPDSIPKWLNGELAVATATNDADEIRRKMAQIRRELHQDVREVVASAEAVTDWRRYLRRYPWVTVGAAFAVGYLIVPKRKRALAIDVATQFEPARLYAAGEDVRPVVTREEPPRKSLLVSAFGVVAPIAWRLAQSYALNHAEQWLAQQQERYRAAAAPPPPSPSPTPPGEPRAPRGTGRTGGYETY